MQRSLLSTITSIEKISEWCGILVSWCVLIMVLIIGYDVSMRFFFRISSGALQELEWHLFAIIFLLGASYTLKHDGHVRVDIFYRSHWVSDIKRAWVDLLGTLFFLLPFCILIMISSVDFVADSYANAERSSDPGGLSHRYLLKAAIPVGFALLMLQGVALILNSINTIFYSSKSNISSEGPDH
jgi:TRAP-type mannitol/chloroaromatic compound transport system permease small subunit